MGDFHQEGVITTIHGLYELLDKAEYLKILEDRLEAYSRNVGMSLLLPCHFRDVESHEVLGNICSELKKVGYLKQIVIALGGAEKHGQFMEAMRVFAPLRRDGLEVRIVWIEGPRVQEVLRQMEVRQIHTGMKGKGQSVWIGLGYILASGGIDVIALHDCDIINYNRVLLGRLLEPTANPNSDLEFCKGYYARISRSEKSMKGRVTRLFVIPFVDAMAGVFGQGRNRELESFFLYHRAFKYPLAGEVSIAARVARGLNISWDWGLEVSTLSEVYQRVAPRKIAQVDLTPNYEHREQDFVPEDLHNGIRRMVVDIARFYLAHMRSHGVPLDDAFVDMMRHTYYQRALSFIKKYSEDAEVNGLNYDRHTEELISRHFQDFLWEAWQQCRTQPGGTLMPSWNRVLYSFPEAYNVLYQAVEEDNRSWTRPT